jgi:Ser/Thr protein kinase RdoA (MazF antagonist)
METRHLIQIFNSFETDCENMLFESIDQGYLNDTYLVSANEKPRFILQRINHRVFPNVDLLMSNMKMALEKLRADDYHGIDLKRTRVGKPYLLDHGNSWRLMTFISGSVTYNTTTDPNIAFEAGRIIGKFHTLLKDESTEDYGETIPQFNDLQFRFTEFLGALDRSSERDKQTARNEIEFALENRHRFDAFYNAELPQRVCHNDTKFNNILFDKDNKALCLIDLDTIMKGYFHYDYGDAVRTIVNTANEDEIDLSRVEFNTDLFESFIDGLSLNTDFLTQLEKDYLPIATALVPFIHGLRALTDFLSGNIYYRVSYPRQNLNRSISIFHFAKLALSHQEYLKDHLKAVLK